MEKLGAMKNSVKVQTTMLLLMPLWIFLFGVIWLLTAWDFSEYGEDGDAFSGIYVEFTAAWFEEVGTLMLETLAWWCVLPSIFAICFLILRQIRRMIDQRSCCPK